MKKKHIIYLLILVILILVFSIFFYIEYKKNSINGLWYSSNLDKITFKNNGKYFNDVNDSKILSKGSYVYKNNVVTISDLTNNTIVLKREKKSKKYILLYTADNEQITFYRSYDDAKKDYDYKNSQKKILEQQKIDELKKSIVGYYISPSLLPIQFTENEEYIKYLFYNTADFVSKYEIDSSKTMKVFNNNGNSDILTLILENNSLNISGILYEKAIKLNLTSNMLIGDWYNNNQQYVFTESKFVEKSVFKDTLKDNEYSYSLTDENTIEINGKTFNIFLSETDTKYQLIIKRSTLDTLFLTRNK